MTLIVIVLILASTIVGAILYGRAQAKAKTVEEWALGGRRFGTLIFWFLNAGEIYTTFAVLGISGFAWAYGAPAYLAFCSVSLAAATGYWLMPRIQAYGRAHGLVTQADFFAHHYRAEWLGAVVGVAGIAALVVYVQIQITALGMILRLAIGPSIDSDAASLAAAGGMLLFVYLAGLRSAAFAAAVKDILMLVLVIGLSATVAGRVGATSMLDVFDRVQDAFPAAGSFPGLKPELDLDLRWLITSAINVALGTWIFPHMFQLCYSAADGATIRRNAVFQPLYSLSYLFIILLGFAALLAGTSPPGGDPNGLLLQFVSDSYPPWVVGAFAGTACLLALVPGSVLLLTCGSIFARNVIRPLAPAMSDQGQLRVSRWSMIGFAAIAVWLTIGADQSLVQIGLSAYAAIGMLVPGAYLALIWPRVTAGPVMLGIIAGYTLLWVPAAKAAMATVFLGWEPGLAAMLVNFVVTIAAALLAGRVRVPEPRTA